MRNITLIFVLLSFIACSQKKGLDATSNLFDKGEKLSEVTSKKLKEASGLASSINNPGLLWTLNDSGNKPEVYLIDEQLNIVMTCKLEGIRNRDWEDISVGPGPVEGKSYLYVAEIGDNLAMFAYKHIYRFEEPVFDNTNEKISITEFDTITFELADGRKDTESIMIHPKTKNLYVISKREKPVYVYELPFPQSTRDTLKAEKIAAIPHSMVVAADFSSDGRELLVKNYQNIFYWNIGDSDLRHVLNEKPFIVEYEEEPQGEAITFKHDGSGFYTISEVVKGYKSYLIFYPRIKKED